MLKPRTLTSTLLALVLAPSLALAQFDPAPTTDPTPAPAAGDGEGFGSAGQIFITDDFDLNWTQTTSGAEEGSILTFSPTLFYFIAPNLAVGGTVGLQYEKLEGAEDGTTTFGLGPSVGYNIPFSPALSLFPTAQIAYWTTSAGDDDYWALPLTVNVPVLFHLMPHLSIGLGPFFRTDLTAKEGFTKTTAFGLDFILGGYF